MALKDLPPLEMFAEVYSWLEKYPTTYVCQAAQSLIHQMKGYAVTGDLPKASQALERVKLFLLSYQELSPDSIGKINLECACVSQTHLYNPYCALQFLDEAIHCYTGFPHYQAVAYWMKGCILWENRSPVVDNDPIVCWQSAINLFNRVQGRTNDKVGWYRERTNEMNAALDFAIENNGPVSASKLDDPQNAPPASPPTPTRLTSTPASNSQNPLIEAFLVSFPFVSSVPAGGFAAAGGPDLYALDRMQVHEVTIGGERYKIYNFPNKSAGVNLIGPGFSTGEIFLFKVTGDSMNRTGILEDDYVLVKKDREAEQNAVVIAEMYTEMGTQVTLKRVAQKSKGKWVLSPDSTNQDHQEFEFDPQENNFHIWGTVLAVLKRI